MIIAGIDGSLRHFGMAKMALSDNGRKRVGAKITPIFDITVLELELFNTEKTKNKQVRVSSDDLQNAREIHAAYHAFIEDCDFVFAEIPTGGKSSTAAKSFGLVIGILASTQIPLIQVMPLETKKATVGSKTASKADMIAWALKKYPDAPWIRQGARVTLANEHLADAVAVAHAGLETAQFAQLQAFMKMAA